jgi:hypothetical protein
MIAAAARSGEKRGDGRGQQAGWLGEGRVGGGQIDQDAGPSATTPVELKERSRSK